MTEMETIADGSSIGNHQHIWRFQLENHLGSAIVELDEHGAVITYEEYHPFGSTAFATTNGNAEVSAKRYRYTGKEKDVETGALLSRCAILCAVAGQVDRGGSSWRRGRAERLLLFEEHAVLPKRFIGPTERSSKG